MRKIEVEEKQKWKRKVEEKERAVEKERKIANERERAEERETIKIRIQHQKGAKTVEVEKEGWVCKKNTEETG